MQAISGLPKMLAYKSMDYDKMLKVKLIGTINFHELENSGI